MRLEQLYPFPKKKLEAVVSKYKNAKRYIWAQEEPENMGAWGLCLDIGANYLFSSSLEVLAQRLHRVLLSVLQDVRKL